LYLARAGSAILKDIQCEISLDAAREKSDSGTTSKDEGKGLNSEEDLNRRPDVYVKDHILVEIETLKGKGFGNFDVYLDLIKRTLSKSEGWPEILDEIWLVLPGFEIARNYYQIKKTEEILASLLAAKVNVKARLIVMAPDYQSHRLVPMSFRQIGYPSFKHPHSQPSPPPPPSSARLNFDDVAGLTEEKAKLRKLIKLSEKGYECGINGILLYGLPGCGKTLLAKAFAGESERYFMSFSPADIQSPYIGETQKNLQNLFSQVKKRCPSVLFIDELDSIGFSRSELHAHTDQKATINQLLIELNNLRGFDVLVIAATNYVAGLDSALRRSGRFDWKIPVFPPDKEERKEIFAFYLSKFQVAHQPQLINIDDVAENSERFTSSDIEFVCGEIRSEILLGEVDKNLTTSDVNLCIARFQEGGLSLVTEQVEGFWDDCQSLGVKNKKLDVLKKAWGIERYK
jgi:DNA polymerase III delta prime subunit